MNTIEDYKDAKNNRYGLAELPAAVAAPIRDGDAVTNLGRGAFLWSGRFPVPAIGEKVAINFNQLGSGVVESYLTEYGWLGVCVRLDDAPDWHRRQTAGTKHAGRAMVFGAELKGEAQ